MSPPSDPSLFSRCPPSSAFAMSDPHAEFDHAVLDKIEATGSWVVHVHDSEDGATRFNTPKLPEALSKLEEVLASAPFHLNELDALGFHMT